VSSPWSKGRDGVPCRLDLRSASDARNTKTRLRRDTKSHGIRSWKSIFREVCAKRGGRGALFAARKRSGRKAASNGSWRSLSFVRFLRSRFETIIFYSACLPSATITGCVQDASYACKKRTPHSRHFRSALAFARRVRVPMGCEPPHYQEFLIMRVIRNFPLSGKGNRV